MATPKPASQTIYAWLKANLGPKCLAPLTGQDAKALLAAVQTIELYSYDRNPAVIDAFSLIVRRMQPQCQELAYHSIAHVMDWSDRATIWQGAELPHFAPLRRCAFES